MKYVDMFGKKIKMGDKIVYPTRTGKILTLKSAVVFEEPGSDPGTRITEGVVCINPNGRRVIVQRTSRCCVVESNGNKVEEFMKKFDKST